MRARTLTAACLVAVSTAIALPASAGAVAAPAGTTARLTTAGTAAAVRSAGLVHVPVSASTRPTAAVQPRAAAAVRLRVPRLGIARPMIRLHVQPDRSLSVPRSFADIGWWSEGPRPGASGATIVGGHISSKAGPGAFYTLRRMQVRDLIAVDRADGTTAIFQVRSVRSFARSNYPSALVYRTNGRSSIHLITCDGTFDPSIGHHVNNLVVLADLVLTRRTAA